jgi:predicted transglutaminase-like cysteine proteinase
MRISGQRLNFADRENTSGAHRALKFCRDGPANAILGSVSVPVAHTPFDLKWSAVNAKGSRVKFDRQLAATGACNLSNQAKQVEAINRWVNRNIAFGLDRDVYGRADHWAPAAKTFRREIGDCEDFAIAKMELLATLGISRDKIRLIVARDFVRNSYHALLMAELSAHYCQLAIGRSLGFSKSFALKHAMIFSGTELSDICCFRNIEFQINEGTHIEYIVDR